MWTMRAVTTVLERQDGRQALAATDEFVEEALASVSFVDPDAVVSELVRALLTDVIDAGGGWMHLRVTCVGDDRIMLEATDTASGHAGPGPLGTGPGGGPALGTVDRVAADWGVDPLPGGRRVWMCLDRSDWVGPDA
jgi:hypothetical protein